MLVKTRRLFGALALRPSQKQDDQRKDQGRQRLAEFQNAGPDSPAPCRPWSNGRAIRPPERFQTQPRSQSGITRSTSM